MASQSVLKNFESHLLFFFLLINSQQDTNIAKELRHRDSQRRLKAEERENLYPWQQHQRMTQKRMHQTRHGYDDHGNPWTEPCLGLAISYLSAIVNVNLPRVSYWFKLGEQVACVFTLMDINPFKTSPEYTQAGVYGKCVL